MNTLRIALVGLTLVVLALAAGMLALYTKVARLRREQSEGERERERDRVRGGAPITRAPGAMSVRPGGTPGPGPGLHQ
jgi:hypothetical protein